MFKHRVIILAFLSVAYAATILDSFVVPQGFEFLGNVEGKIFLKPTLNESDYYGVTWMRAIEICNNAGYRMATITSKVQDDVLENYVTVGDVTKWMWIDGTNFATDPDQWFSLNTGKNLTFTNWVPGRPTTMTGSNCLRWSRNPFDAGWWDVSCFDTHNVLCETTSV